MKTVLVTGANGLLATHIILHLLQKNYAVRGLLRCKEKFKGGTHNNLELIEGDITQIDTIEKAISGCEYIIHAAAITAQNLLQYNDYSLVNIESTHLLIRFAIANKVKKFVFISSANTIGFGTKEKPGREGQPIRNPFAQSWYAQSKVQAETIVLDYQDYIDIVVLNPTFMLGTYGTAHGSNRIISMVIKNRVVFCPPGGKNFVAANDVAKGTVLALEWGNNGKTYLLANENLSYKEFFKKAASATSTKIRCISIPKFVLILIGSIGSFVRLFGIKTSLSLTNARILCVNNFYDNKKSINELNMSYQPIEQAIKQAACWLEQVK